MNSEEQQNALFGELCKVRHCAGSRFKNNAIYSFLRHRLVCVPALLWRPLTSQRAEMALMEEIRCAKKAFAASFESSADL